MRLKKTLGLLLACTLVPTAAFAASTPAPASQEIHVLYNQKQLSFPDQKPVIRNSRTLVPIRPIAEGLGFTVNWNNQTRTVSIDKSTNSINLVVDQKTAKRNGQAITLDAPAQIINGRTMVPVRFIAEALSYQVNWNAASHQVLISDNSSSSNGTTSQAYGQLGNVTLSSNEADKMYKAYMFLFTSNQSMPSIIEQIFRRQSGDNALYGKYLMATYGNKYTPTDEQLNQTMERAKASVMDRKKFTTDQYNTELAKSGITEQDIKTMLSYDLYTTLYVYSTLTDQEKQDYYKNHPEISTVASVRHILVDTLDQANAVVSRLNKGESFASLAKELSKDPGSKDNGGLYENIPVSNWVKGFMEATLTQPIGKVGQPVKTEYGYHVILVEKRSTLPFAQVESSVAKGLTSEKTKELRKEAFANLQKK